MDETKGLILATVFITGAVTLVDQLSGRKPISFRSYLGDSMMGIFLTGIAMVNERLARNFCLLIILTVLLEDKGSIFAWAGNAGNKVKAPTPATAAPGGGGGHDVPRP